ncbi:hypothetical protein KQX54_013457 [Cotesia glomerata]|uniref:Uncharacterized protein n=1 Tax=Cotesia glomerata TaxID=32391 RepID=A0AAV7J1N5_COTGL|nr:hypothetical protein KQX54_013457 [Cotesia glomerata]
MCGCVRNVCGRSELQPGKVVPEVHPHQLYPLAGKWGVSSLPASSSSSPPSLEERLKSVHPVNTQPHRPVPTQLHVQLGNFLASVVRSRTFYGTLADNICEEYPDKHCWNGERVGELPHELEYEIYQVLNYANRVTKRLVSLISCDIAGRWVISSLNLSLVTVNLRPPAKAPELTRLSGLASV